MRRRQSTPAAKNLMQGLVIGVLFLPLLSISTCTIREIVYPAANQDPAREQSAQTEADELLHTARRSVQQAYRGGGSLPLVLAGEHPGGTCGLDPSELEGDFYVVINGIQLLDDGRAQVVGVPRSGDFPVVRMPFYPSDTSGESITVRHPGR